MKPTLLFVLLAFAVSSCSEFQYITLAGIDNKPTKAEELVFENDTLRVIYHFNHERDKTGITIFNKTSEPLEIDWKRSALVVNARTYSYYNSTVTFSGQIDTIGLNGRGGMPNVSGVVALQDALQFVPPQASVSRTTFDLPVKRLNYKEADVQKATINHNNFNTKYKKVVFTQGTTPLIVRSYLSFRLGASSAPKDLSLEHRFYVSEIWASGFSPIDFPDEAFNRGNRVPVNW